MIALAVHMPRYTLVSRTQINIPHPLFIACDKLSKVVKQVFFWKHVRPAGVLDRGKNKHLCENYDQVISGHQ